MSDLILKVEQLIHTNDFGNYSPLINPFSFIYELPQGETEVGRCLERSLTELVVNFFLHPFRNVTDSKYVSKGNTTLDKRKKRIILHADHHIQLFQGVFNYDGEQVTYQDFQGNGTTKLSLDGTKKNLHRINGEPVQLDPGNSLYFSINDAYKITLSKDQ